MSESKRAGINEREILSVECPTCCVPAGKICRMKDAKTPLAYEIGATEFSFHITRVILAQDTVIKRLGFGEALTPSEKGLILYYSFIMLCDSVSTKSELIFGRKMESEDIQKFFAFKAVEELRNDGLMKNARARKS